MATIKRRTWTTSKGERREAWVVRYADQDGKWRLKTFDRQRDAKEWLPKAQVEVKQRTHRPDSTAPTVSEACEMWIRSGEVDGLERSTLVQRREHVDGHILPLLGAETKLSKVDVKTFRLDLLSTRSRPMAKKVLTSFRAVLKDAKMSHLAADVKAIETGGRHKKRLEVGVDIPTPEEVRSLWPHAQGYIRPLLAIAVFCGLRMSEVRGLRWQDADLEARELHVKQRADKWQQIGPLKSETSYRSIPMSPFVVNALRDWRGDRIYSGEALVFGTRIGTVQSLPNIWRRHLAPLQVAAGVVDRDGKAKYGAHAFRHFYASWRLERGDNIKRVSERMGHSSPVVTLTLYSHLMPQADEHERLAADELALVG